MLRESDMAITQHLSGICKGATIGFLLGLAAIATIDHSPVPVFHVLGKPLEWLLGVAQRLLAWNEGTTAIAGWLGTALYWMLIGALLGFLASRWHAKAKRNQGP